MFREGERGNLAKLDSLNDCEATRLRQLSDDIAAKNTSRSTQDPYAANSTGKRQTKRKRLRRTIGYRTYHLKKANRISMIGILIIVLLALLAISPVICMYVACFAFFVLFPMAQAAYWLFEIDCLPKNGCTHRNMINMWLGRDRRETDGTEQNKNLDEGISK